MAAAVAKTHLCFSQTLFQLISELLKENGSQTTPDYIPTVPGKVQWNKVTAGPESPFAIRIGRGSPTTSSHLIQEFPETAGVESGAFKGDCGVSTY